VILTQSNNKVTGSARSINGFDLYQAIMGCSDLLEKFGGHKYAAGLTMDVTNVEAFQQRFEEVVTASITSDMLTPVIEIDMELPFDSITAKFLNILKQMAPFGPENQRPVFESKNVFVYNSLSTMKDRHIRFYASQEGSEIVLPVVGFDMAEFYEPLCEQQFFRMAYTVEENVYNGNTSIQLRLKDIKFD
jgi:single-stranded-DNA-specific exonuclease